MLNRAMAEFWVYGSGWLGMARDGSRWLGMARDGSGWLGMARDGSGWLGMLGMARDARDGSGWLEMARDGSRWLGMARDGSRWLEMGLGNLGSSHTTAKPLPLRGGIPTKALKTHHRHLQPAHKCPEMTKLHDSSKQCFQLL